MYFVLFQLKDILVRVSDNRAKVALANRDTAQAELELAKLNTLKN